MFETIKTNWRRYVESSIVTFLAVFLPLVIPQLLSENFEWTKEAILGLLVMAVRIGLKAVWEIFAPAIVNSAKR